MLRSKAWFISVLCILGTSSLADEATDLINWYEDALEADPFSLYEMSWDLTPEQSEIIAEHLIAEAGPTAQTLYLELPRLTRLPDSISTLTSLISLDVLAASMNDVSALAGVPNLEELKLTQVQIVSFDEVPDLPQLKRLYLENALLEDLDGLERFENIDRLNISGVPLYAGLPDGLANRLSVLVANNTGLRDLGIEPGQPCMLRSLSVAQTEIASLQALSGCSDLEVLTAYGTKITSLEGLEGLGHLVDITVYSTPLTDISALAEVENLELLYMRNTEVSRIDALMGLPSLRGVELTNTLVTDGSALLTLPVLAFVEVSGSPVAQSNEMDILRSRGVAVR